MSTVFWLFALSAAFVPNDPHYSTSGSWGQAYDDLWALKAIDAEHAWDSARGAGIIVAVIDTGVELAHPDLQANLWTNPAEIAGNGLDDDQNGAIDDVHGWNPIENNGDVEDHHGRGTHVAGVIAAIGDNSTGIIGVAPEAKIMVLKALDDDAVGMPLDVAEAIVYAVYNGAQVIHVSWSCVLECEPHPALEYLIPWAKQLGATVIVAAGDHGEDTALRSPQSFSEAIVVSSVDRFDLLAAESNLGFDVDLVAPGGDDDVLTLYSASPWSDLGQRVGGSYYRTSGTPIAAAFVSGVAALILSREPTWSHEQVRQALRKSAIDLGPAGFDPETGYGRVDAFAAVSITDPLEVAITSPDDGAIFGPLWLELRGSVAGPGLASWRLEYADGALWIELASGTTPIVDGVLGYHGLGFFAGGDVLLRLTAANFAGESYEDHLWLSIDQAGISSPRDRTPIRAGSIVELRGTADGPGFSGYAITIEDGAGGSVFSGGGAARVGDALLESWNTAGLAADHYRVELDVSTTPAAEDQITLTLVDTEAGWPQAIGRALPERYDTQLRDQLSTADIDGDGKHELLLAYGRTLYVFDGSGAPLPGWPRDLALDGWPFSTNVAPIVGDLDGDGTPNIITAADEHIFVLEPDGSRTPGWPIHFSDSPTHLALADLDGNGTNELIVGTGYWLRVLDASGASLPGFPRSLYGLGGPLFYTGFAVGDADLDGRQEIAIATFETYPFSPMVRLTLIGSAGQNLPSWPREFPTVPIFGVSAPLFVDLDGDGDLEIVTAFDGATYARHHNGNAVAGWPAATSNTYANNAVAGDLDADGSPEIVTAVDDYQNGQFLTRIHAWHADGTAVAGWPIEYVLAAPSSGFGVPVIADVDGDGLADVVAILEGSSAEPCLLYAFRYDGTPALGFPKIGVGPGATRNPSPAIADLDGDGLAEVAAIDDAINVYVWGTSAAAGAAAPWPMSRQNSEHTAAPKRTPPDFALTAISGPASAQAGALINVSTTVVNLGPGPGAPSTLGLFLSSDPTIDPSDTRLTAVQVPSILAGASNAASTSVRVPAATPPGTYYLGAIADELGAVYETSESNNTRTSSAFTVTAGADLVVTAASAPANVHPGTAFTLSNTVRNQGAGAAPAFVIGFYLSADATITTGDLLLGTRSLSGLNAAQNSAVSSSLTIPAGTAAGSYFIGVIADHAAQVFESDELNNTRFLASNVTYPDLIVVSVSGPASVAPNTSASISTTYRNQGLVASGAMYLGLYLSTDNQISTADVFLGNFSTSGLAASTSASSSFSTTIPAAITAGTYFFGAIADASAIVAETNEANNTLAGGTTAIGADLIFSALSGPNSVVPGTIVTLSSTVRNQGIGVSAPCNATYYLSTDATITTADIFIGGGSIAAIAAGATQNISPISTIPSSIAAGTYFFGAIADRHNTAVETDETNNAFTGGTTAIGADLVITSVSSGASLPIGAAGTVNFIAANQGIGVSSSFTVGFYLSTDATITTADILIGTYAASALSGGANVNTNRSVTVPAATAAGTYFLGAIADSTNTAIETNESNNARAGNSVVLGADLTMTALSAAATATTGATWRVDDTVHNAGAGTSAAFSVGYYLSADATITTADTSLGTRSVSALAGGASNTGFANLTVPGSLAAGSYYLGAIADSPAQAVETNETNNTRAFGPITVFVGPDLVISAVSSAATLPIGSAATISLTVRNQGIGLSGATIAGVYLSTDATITSADTRIGTYSVPSLAAGASSSSANVSVTVPAGLAGTYHLGAIADDNGLQPERLESNNALAGNTVVVGQDLLINSVSAAATATTGLAFRIDDTVSNLGPAVSGNFSVGYYLSVDSTITTADTLLGVRGGIVLAAGASNSGFGMGTIPVSIAPGVYYLGAFADYASVLPETNEANNAFSVVQIRVFSGPDLTISAISGPASGRRGSSISVSRSVWNRGIAASGSFTARIYLSTDAVITSSDVSLSLAPISNLAAGATQTNSIALTIPSGTAVGSYFLGAIADSADTVRESNEANNAAAASATISIMP